MHASGARRLVDGVTAFALCLLAVVVRVGTAAAPAYATVPTQVTFTLRAATTGEAEPRTATLPRNHRLPCRYFTTVGRHHLVLSTCTDRVVHVNGRFHYPRYRVVVAAPIRAG
jgi:hypothetical protein